MELSRLLDFGELNLILEIYPTMHFEITNEYIKGKVDNIEGNTSFIFNANRLFEVEKILYGTDEEKDAFLRILSKWSKTTENINIGDIDGLLTIFPDIKLIVSHDSVVGKLHKDSEVVNFSYDEGGLHKMYQDKIVTQEELDKLNKFFQENVKVRQIQYRR